MSAGVVDTGGEPVVANICANFRKKIEMELNEVSGGWGKMIHEKNPEVKNLVTMSMNGMRRVGPSICHFGYI